MPHRRTSRETLKFAFVHHIVLYPSNATNVVATRNPFSRRVASKTTISSCMLSPRTGKLWLSLKFLALCGASAGASCYRSHVSVPRMRDTSQEAVEPYMELYTSANSCWCTAHGSLLPATPLERHPIGRNPGLQVVHPLIQSSDFL